MSAGGGSVFGVGSSGAEGKKWEERKSEFSPEQCSLCSQQRRVSEGNM